MEREWKDIDGYSNYQVRDGGDVRNKKTGRVLKHGINNGGYHTVNLYNNGHKHSKGVHQIVAEAFIDGYEDGLEVNHVDGNKNNNAHENLEWCTHSENELHAYKTGLKHGPGRRPVRVIESGEVFPSIRDCARALDGDDRHIGKCLSGLQRTHLGLHYEYADPNEVNASSNKENVSPSYICKKLHSRPVRIVETDEVFPSARECARTIGADQGTITACLKGRHKTHHGFHYEYAD